MDVKLDKEDGRTRIHLALTVGEHYNILAAVIGLAAAQHHCEREKLAHAVTHCANHPEDPEAQEWLNIMAECCPTGKLLKELALSCVSEDLTAGDKQEIDERLQRRKHEGRGGDDREVLGLFKKEEAKAEAFQPGQAVEDEKVGVPTFLLPKGFLQGMELPPTHLNIHCLNNGQRATIRAEMGAFEAYALFGALVYGLSNASGIPYAKLADGLIDENSREDIIRTGTRGIVGGEVVARWLHTLADMDRVVGEEDKRDAQTLKDHLKGS